MHETDLDFSLIQTCFEEERSYKNTENWTEQYLCC